MLIIQFQFGYATEEMIAETSTMFICLDEQLQSFNSHAKYLEGWASHFCK
jgi:antirestriction protein ArdC